MIRTRTAFVTLLLLLVATTTLAAPVRLARDVIPVSESITMKLDPRADTYGGTAAFELDVKKPVPSFSLHAENIEIASVTVGGAAAKFDKGPNNTLVITPSSPLKTGRTTMTIDFSNEYDRTAVGLYKMVRKDEPYLFTQFQAIDARKAFPCWDEPGFKLPYQLTATVPSQYEVVFNTPVESQSEADGWKTVRFAKTKPLPAYLLAIAAGSLEFTPVPGTSIPTRIITVKGQSGLTKVAVQQTPPVLKALEQYFGMPYPFEKLDLIAVPEYWMGAMENPGLITYAENILLMDEKASPSQRRTNARVTAHELAHMWFGDLVTMAWWDDLWLNESFADWMGDKIAHQVYPEYGIEMNELENVQHIMNVDASPLTNAIRKRDVDPIEAMRSVGIAYNKGKAVISMFERWLGSEEFRKGVNNHLKAHAWGNATAADFWSALGKQTAAPMGTFIDQPGVPLITVEKTGANEVRLTQSRYLRHGVTAPNQTWQVPVALRYSDGNTTKVKTVLLDAPSKVVTLDAAKVDWVFPHADAAGYYRWRVPSRDFLALADRASTALTPGERIAFLGNLTALLNAGSIRGNEYLDVLNRFSNESEPNVLSALLSALGVVDMALTEHDRPLFAAYVRKTLAPVLERIGYEKKAGESPGVTILRPQLLSWVAVVGEDPKAIDFAKAQAAKYMADPSSVDPGYAGVVLRVNAASGDMALFEEYRKRFEAATTPAERSRFLSAMSGFKSKEIRDKALEYVLSGGTLRPPEMFSIPAGFMRDEEGRTFIQQWLMKNYDVFTARVPPAFRAGMARMGGGCDEKRLAVSKEFFMAEGRKVEGTERELARAEEQVRECVAFRTREGETVRAYLRQQAQ